MKIEIETVTRCLHACMFVHSYREFGRVLLSVLDSKLNLIQSTEFKGMLHENHTCGAKSRLYISQ